MLLSDLVGALTAWSGTVLPHTEVGGVAIDSRRVEPGDLFVAIPGQQADGHHYVAQAIAAGAVAVVVERAVAVPAGIGRIQVPSCRLALSALANRFYAQPARELNLVGITGTNGKTTVACLVRDLALAAGGRPGVIGTAGVMVGDRVLEAKSGFTTPEAHQLHRLLREMVNHGADTVALEVTSHALDQHRTDHCPIRVAVFTNLTHEHLDYHQDLAAYFRVKARLFTELAPGSTAVINLDDPYGRQLRDLVPAGVQTLTYSLAVDGADLRASAMATDRGEFWLDTPVGSARVRMPHLLGRYNIANALAALGAGVALGWSLPAMVAALGESQGAPGRFQRVDRGQDFAVIVDYAHTPDGFAQFLGTVAEMRPPGARMIMVFGSAGHRDRSKRPDMGRIAGDYCDVLVLTEEDPRTESVTDINADIIAGVRNPGCRIEQVEDRLEAIDRAIGLARPGDMVLITGKGNETELEVQHPTRFRGDIPAAEAALARRRTKAGRRQEETA